MNDDAANGANTADHANTATVESLSALYLGNILYALERCAISLAAEGKAEDAGFYRGIGRVLAEARGRERQPHTVNSQLPLRGRRE